MFLLGLIGAFPPITYLASVFINPEAPDFHHEIVGGVLRSARDRIWSAVGSEIPLIAYVEVVDWDAPSMDVYVIGWAPCEDCR